MSFLVAFRSKELLTIKAIYKYFVCILKSIYRLKLVCLNEIFFKEVQKDIIFMFGRTNLEYSFYMF